MKILNFKQSLFLILLLQSTFFHSQSLPIIGFGDAANYTIGNYSVPGSSGLDLHWYGGIRFGDWTSNSVMQITNGNVGIGTTSPQQKFVVSKGSTEGLEVYLGQPNGTVGLQVYNRSTSQYNKMAFAASQFTFNFGNLGIGTENPRANFDMAKDISNGQLGTVFGRLPEGDGTGLGTYLGVKGYATQGPNEVKSFSIVHDFYGQTNSSINFYRGGSTIGGFMTFNTYDNTEKMRIGANGYVGIGTTSPDSKLTVKGKIHAEEVKIDLAVPADYVFEKYYLGKSSIKPDYKLLTLSEVEKFTAANHHLPNVPSAKEIKENGLLLGEMSNILLQKIEELTLYSIEQQKENNLQYKKIELQLKEIEILKKENESFKSLSKRLSKIENKLKTAN